MKSKKILGLLVGAATLISGGAMAQANQTDAMIVSYDSNTKIAVIRDLTTGETVTSQPTAFELNVEDMVMIERLPEKAAAIVVKKLESIHKGGSA